MATASACMGRLHHIATASPVPGGIGEGCDGPFLSQAPDIVKAMNRAATSSATRTRATSTSPRITIEDTLVRVDELVIDDEAVASHLNSLAPEQRSGELIRAIALGIHGLAATQLRATVDDMKDEVQRIIAAAAQTAEACVDEAVAVGRSALMAQLDPEVRSSLTARAVGELESLHAATLARLDPDRSDSHTAKLVAAITDLLGPSGLLAQRLEAAFDSAEADHGFGRLLDLVERRFLELRDLVVGDQHRKDEAQRGTAKGFDFEDEVEAVLRREAKSIGGCVVERTGHVPGTLGSQSKVGDFTVTLSDGTVVVVEAKNAGRIALAGTTGILSELDAAMANRNASWALCISGNEAFPAEVGSFGVYGNRILVVEEGDGTLPGVALRWISAAAAASTISDDRADTPVALEGLARIRDLAQHFSRSKRVLGTAQTSLESVKEDLDGLRTQLLDLVEDVSRALRPPASTDRRVA